MQLLTSEERRWTKINFCSATVNPEVFGGKPINRGRRLADEHVLGMLVASDSTETLLAGYPWLEREDILACLACAHRVVEHERIEPFLLAAD